MDLIDRQAVQEIVDRIGDIYPYRQIGNRESYSQYNEAWTDAINRVDAELNSLPSADAVEVVRCKDCKYWDIFDIHSTICPDNRRCKGIIGKMYTPPDYYCAYGERKDGLN